MKETDEEERQKKLQELVAKLDGLRFLYHDPDEKLCEPYQIEIELFRSDYDQIDWESPSGEDKCL